MSVMEEFLKSFSQNALFTTFNALMQEPFFIIFMVLMAFIAILLVKKSVSRVSLLISLAVVAILVNSLKFFYGDPRPCDGLVSCEEGFGFPSGHAALAFAIATPTFGTKYFYFFIALAALIALSRVVAGVHSIPQIVGGAVLGFLISIILNILISGAFEKVGK